MTRTERDRGHDEETAERSRTEEQHEHEDAGTGDSDGTEHIDGGAFTANPDVYDDREQGSGAG